MTTRWRGTLIYTGAVAAMGAAGFAKFAVLAPPAAVSGGDTSTSASSSVGSGAASGSSSGSSTSGSSGSSASSTGSSGTTTKDTVTVVGKSVQTRYGPVQVSVTFTKGQIADVQALQVPGGHQESVQINARATPILAREVIAAQSAHIDTVSGATYTSEAYAQSVQAAIDQAG